MENTEKVTYMLIIGDMREEIEYGTDLDSAISRAGVIVEEGGCAEVWGSDGTVYEPFWGL